MKGILSTNDIALLQNVNRSRISQIWCHYKNAKTVPTTPSESEVSNKQGLIALRNLLEEIYELNNKQIWRSVIN
jgi:hypothetical protein